MSVGYVLIVTAMWVYIRPSDDEKNEFVRTVAQLTGAAFLGVGLVYTHRTVMNSQETLKHQRKTQQDERYFQAAALLGETYSDNERIAALFVLERLAKDTDDYYHQVTEVICEFVRQRSLNCLPSEEELKALDELNPMRITGKHEGIPIRERETYEFPQAPNDIAVAMKVLGRRTKRFGVDEERPLDLRRANLSGLRLRKADLQGANLEGAFLINATLHDCNLAHSRLYRSDLRFAHLARTALNHANVQHAKADHAYFYYAGNVKPPANFVVVPQTDEEGNTTWKMPEHDKPKKNVNASRYLDDSRWDFTTLQGADFQCGDFSGMGGLTKSQYDSFTKFSDAIPPTFQEPIQITIDASTAARLRLQEHPKTSDDDDP